MTDITLLDGSIGQELMKRSGDTPTALWSTQVMIDHPHLVQDVHEDYFMAGATIATTNTYAVMRDRLTRVGLEDRVAALAQAAISAARAARDTHGGGRLAGAIGPLVQSYRPDLCPPPEVAASLYAESVTAIADAGVDLFLLETMASTAQAEGALMAVKSLGRPVWLAVSVDDRDGTRLRSGEPVSALANVIETHRPDAILINCSPPEAVTQALPDLAAFGLPFGAYANGFTHISDGFLDTSPTVDTLSARTDLSPSVYADHVMDWIDLGATIVGGCCEVGPAHIAEIAGRLARAGHSTV